VADLDHLARRLKPREKATRASIAEVKDDFSRYLRVAAKEEVIITRHGQPSGVLIGFDSEDDWFEYRLERDPTFLTQVSEARAALRRGEGVRLEDVEGQGSLTRVWSRPFGSEKPRAARLGPRDAARVRCSCSSHPSR
jgi:prevent-host-death family protein